MIMLRIQDRLVPRFEGPDFLLPLLVSLCACGPRTGYVQAPHQPRDDEVAWFNQWSGDKRETGCQQPGEHRTDVMATVVRRKFRSCGEARSCRYSDRQSRLWRIGIIWKLLRRRLHVWKTAESSDGGPSGVKVDRYSEVLIRRMAEENAEDIESIVTVVGEGKRMDYGIEVDDSKHNGYDRYGDDEPRDLMFSGTEAEG